jgi:hypothetical protein
MKGKAKTNSPSAKAVSVDNSAHHTSADPIKTRKIILLASHDDGSGAHVIMCRICRGLIEVLREKGGESPLPLLVYLNKGSYETKEKKPLVWARSMWENSIGHGKCDFLERLDSLPSDKDLEHLDAIWLQTNNVFQFKKDDDGKLDAKGTREFLTTVNNRFNLWAYQIVGIPMEKVALAIEMGVPALSRWAHQHKLPAIWVGDMLWSKTLLGSLAGAGEYDDQVRDTLHSVAESERCATAAFLLPIIAPRSYADFFSEHRVPTMTLSGFFGSKEDGFQVSQEKAKELHEAFEKRFAKMKDRREVTVSIDSDSSKSIVTSKLLKLLEENVKVRVTSINLRDLLQNCEQLVVLSSGMTGVWKKIYSDIQKKYRELARKGFNEFALVSPSVGASGFLFQDGGEEFTLPQISDLAPYYSAAHLGVTRGGVTMIDFMSCSVPFIVVQEPNHWLSQIQQAQANDAGLCHASSLSIFQDPEKAIAHIGLGDKIRADIR